MKAPESEEILRKVKELQLPLNFYDYETMEPCKGCRGCRDDDYYFKTDSKPQVKDHSNPDDSNSNSLFRSAIAATNVSQSEWKTNSSPKSWMTKPLYCQRAKLYRFDPTLKEWKERGIGDFKILKHKSKNRYRMILRRDQILKIACNHYITPAVTLNPMNTSETAICWYAIDYSDGSPAKQQFALKLKNKDLLKEFIKLFEDCKSNLENSEYDNSDNEDRSRADEDTDAEEDQQN
ncbi:unnamed protein product [Oppiella nova]|uniref:RanBD1 domain-containing protein n=1 Tax=Oppiella nova TaxID=334625 RepID=A0A7R9QAE0_9ACAR|nr:unnamed protein product [Oppiella nova]CAG2161801.1 unnamed protein product [Oppiella nova]